LRYSWEVRATAGFITRLMSFTSLLQRDASRTSRRRLKKRACPSRRVPGGRLRVPDSVEAGELAIFEPSTDAIDFHADGDSEFVLGSAAPHAHDLVLGQYSVHTSAAALTTAEQRLRRSSNGCSTRGDSESPTWATWARANFSVQAA